jgi:hypothetical protein
MPGFMPGIHVFLSPPEGVDGRDEPGHDGVIAIDDYSKQILRQSRFAVAPILPNLPSHATR